MKYRLCVFALLFVCFASIAPAEEASSESNAFASLDALSAKTREGLNLPGLSVGVVRDQELVFAKGYGFADPAAEKPATEKTLYRIGSITKVFTTTLLALARDAGEVRLDDAIDGYVPEGIEAPKALPGGAPAITLRHLATHTSGLPRLPNNLKVADGDPYNGYSLEKLWECVDTVKLRAPIGHRFSYSNVGNGLLGQILAKNAGKDYETLATERLLKPLKMSASGFDIGRDHAEWAVGHEGAEREPVEPWDLGALSPTGGIVSNIEDMAKFLALQHRAGGEAESAVVSSGSLFEMHTVQRLDGESWKSGVGLGWIIQPDEQIGGNVVWHNGGTAGCRSWLGFSPAHKIGVIVLTNCNTSIDQFGLQLLRESIKATAAERAAAVPDQARAIVARLARFFEEDPPEEYTDLFHPDFLALINAKQLDSFFGGLRQGMGGVASLEEIVATDEPSTYRAKLKMERGQLVTLGIGYDESDDPKIIYCEFLAVN